MTTRLDVLGGFLQKEYATMVAIAAAHPFPTQYEQKLVGDKIQSVDLSPVHAKLMDRENVLWTIAKMWKRNTRVSCIWHTAIKMLNGFLVKKLMQCGICISCTQKIYSWCLMSLGFFLHHRPDDGSGMIPDSDRQFTADAFASIGIKYIIPSEYSGGTKCRSCTI